MNMANPGLLAQIVIALTTAMPGISQGAEATAKSNVAPHFVERFETNTVRSGALHKKNGWIVSKTGAASLTTRLFYEGTQSARIAASNGIAVVSHLIGSAGDETVEGLRRRWRHRR